MKSTAPPNPHESVGSSEQFPLYDSDGIARAFAESGAPPPLVTWQPSAKIAECQSTTAFHAACDQLTGGQSAISEENLDLWHFGAMKDWLALVKLAGKDGTYRYTHFGDGITRFYGSEMGIKTTADLLPPIRKFNAAIFEHIRQYKQRVLTVHQPPDQVFVTTWRRLMVPVVDAAGNVTQILTSNYPDNELRAGLEILPISVLIVDADDVVRYANKVARQTFDAGNSGPWSRTMFSYAGIDLQIRESPEEILAHGMTQTTNCRHIMHKRMGLYQATVSAALHQGTAFYIVVLLPQS